MIQKIDPFVAAFIYFNILMFVLLAYIFISERQDRNNKAQIVKEAIEKNWTPEQIKVLIEAR